MLDLCKTRWAESQGPYHHFYQAYVYITEALELIGYRWDMVKYGDTYANWDTSSRSNAQQVLASITTFEFIVVFLIVAECLSMRHIILRGQQGVYFSAWLCIYVYIYVCPDLL